MVTPRPELPSALCDLSDTIDPLPLVGQAERDTSLTRQLDELYDLECDLPKPDAILLTTNSALPVADSVRGYLDERGIQQPLISYIRVNRYEAVAHEHAAGVRPSHHEVRRVKELLQGLGHVCIIDQYTHRGITISYAGKVVRAAGIPHVTGIRGQWYGQVKPKEFSLSPASSPHATYMRSIGVDAARQ